jgi:hypothetical protein
MNNRSLFIRSVLLSIPVFLFILHHLFFHDKGLIPTGFTLDDNPVYMANARQYLDAGNWSPFYSNPFDATTGSPAIYLQPHNFLFAILVWLGLDPGFIFTLFGLVFTVLSIFIGLKIIQQVYPQLQHKTTIQLLFTWGGGLLAITGLLVAMFYYRQIPPSLDSIFIGDPGNGWWGLNYGRTLFIPLEAYYHFLFLLGTLFILRKKWKAALAAAFFLAITHPFTGIEFLLIIGGWSLFEKLIRKNKELPWYFPVGIGVVTGLTAWYYLFYLVSFPEHRILHEQFSVGWTYSLYVIIPAYILVLILSGLSYFREGSFKKMFEQSPQRLFFAWGIIAFLLSKHEWFIKPMQPIHFTRGYTWMGLFLFGIPALVWILNKLKASKRPLVASSFFLLVFLSDNILWTINLLRKKEKSEWIGHLKSDTVGVLKWMSKNLNSTDLVFSNEYLVNYYSNVYGKSYSWHSHVYNTPLFAERKAQADRYLSTGEELKEWQGWRKVIVMRKIDPGVKILFPPLKLHPVFENNGYIVFIP